MNNVHKTLGKHILADGMPLVMNLEKSKGSYIHDDVTNSEYLDMFSMFASGSIGYNHPHLVANQEFLGRMAINKPTMADIYTKEYAEFMEVMERVAIPKELDYCFFVSGGALAVENALKAAFDWKTRLNFSKGIVKEADQTIHFKEAFHGRSGYTMSLTNTADPRKHMYFPKFDWPRVTNPKLTFPITEENLEETIQMEEEAIEQILWALEANPDGVASIIVETIQGEGGDNQFRDEFMVALRDICDAFDILLIFDEVQTGVGITGKMWAYEHYSINPDIISFGKKTQVCGILANREKFDQVEKHVFVESSRLNSTFGGNYIDMMRFKLILEVIEKENLVDNAAKMGDYLKAELEKFAEGNDNISNARGVGLWCSFDLPTGEERDAFLSKAFESKLLLLPCGDQSVRFRPHLNVTKADLDKAMDICKKIA